MVSSFIPQFAELNNTLPPQNIDAEESILGACLLNPEVAGIMDRIIPSEAFSLRAHQLLAEIILHLHRLGKPTDLLTVTTTLSNRGKLEVIGGQNKLAQLVDRTVSSVNVDLYCDLVKQKWIAREAQRIAHQFSAKIGDKLLGEDPTSLLKLFKAKIEELQNLTGSAKRKKIGDYYLLTAELDTIDQLEDPAEREYELEQLAKAYNLSPKSIIKHHNSWLASKKQKKAINFIEFQKRYRHRQRSWFFKGFIPTQTITTISADSGLGKTRLMFTMIRHLLRGENWGDIEVPKKCAVLFIETDQGEDLTSELAEEQDFDILTNEEKTRLHLITPEDDGGWQIERTGQLKEHIRSLKESIPSGMPIMVIIDSLFSVSNASLYQEKDVEYARPIMRLREIFHDEPDTSILILHHTNRMGTARGSSAIFASTDINYIGEAIPGVVGSYNLRATKSRCYKPQTMRVTADADTGLWNITGVVETNEDGSQRVEAMVSPNQKELLAVLNNHPGTAFTDIELSEILQRTQAAVRRDLNRLKEQSLISCVRKWLGNIRKNHYHTGNRIETINSETPDQTRSVPDQSPLIGFKPSSSEGYSHPRSADKPKSENFPSQKNQVNEIDRSVLGSNPSTEGNQTRSMATDQPSIAPRSGGEKINNTLQSDDSFIEILSEAISNKQGFKFQNGARVKFTIEARRKIKPDPGHFTITRIEANPDPKKKGQILAYFDGGHAYEDRIDIDCLMPAHIPYPTPDPEPTAKPNTEFTVEQYEQLTLGR